VNVKRAVAAVAGVIGTLILVAAVGAGYLTGHHSSARPATAAVAHAVAVTQSGTAHVAASHAAPVTATLDTFIYGGSGSGPAIFGDGLDLSLGTTTSGDGTAATGSATAGTSSGGAVSGVITLAIYGD
jgi:membrane protein involved in colicin uptake